jgi:hypothetical protein
MLSVTNAECHIIALYSECRYAECHYAECRYAECHYAECRYAECRGVLNYAARSGSVKMAKKLFPVACTLKPFTAVIVTLS